MFNALKQWVNFKVIFSAILFAVIVFGVLVGILWSAKANNTYHAPGTAMLNIIEASTQTPLAPLTTPTPTVEPTAEPHVPLPSGDIAVGDYVQVIGTGGDGLRLHITAGVSSEVHYIAIETEVFLVEDGPIDKDDYTWWLLKDPYTEDAVGWGVANYLAVVPNP